MGSGKRITMGCTYIIWWRLRAKGISESGLAKWLGEQLKMLDGVHPLVIVIVITLFVLFLTEVTSNTATATMILLFLRYL